MGLFSRKKNKTPDNTSMAAKQGGLVQPPQSNDPSLPGSAGWCGGAKTGDPLRFSYKRPDGKPDRKRGFWSDPDDY